MKVLLCVWILLCFAGGYAFAEESDKQCQSPSYSWSVIIQCYQGTGVWQDVSGKEGKLNISFVTELRGVEINFWLKVNYENDQKKGKKLIFASRFFHGEYPFELYDLDGWPIGEAVTSSGDYDYSSHPVHSPELTYTIAISSDEKIKLKLATPNEGKYYFISGVLTEKNDHTMQWDDVKLTRY